MVQKANRPRVIGKHVNCGGDVVRERDLGDHCTRCGESSKQWSWSDELESREPKELEVEKC
jgi:hypothetical protein